MLHGLRRIEACHWQRPEFTEKQEALNEDMSMTFNQKQLAAIFEKTDGRCHICREKLDYKNYGVIGARGAWEVDHSVPQAAGGSHRVSNLRPSCIFCNRSKGASSTRTAREKHGYRSAPLSKAKKVDNAWLGGILGGIAGLILPPPLRLLGIAIGASAGVFIGRNYQPR